MEIPGRVSVYCPLIDAKGTPATLVAVAADGYYHVEVAVKGARHIMWLPIATTALLFAEPEEVIPPGFEIER